MPDAPLMLTVSGARGIVGKTMTPVVAHDYAAAFGTFIPRSDGAGRPTICLGRDSRPSGEELATAASDGLIKTGCRVIDLGIVATPTVGVMIAEHGAAGGLIITASHNPTEWNGLKCLNADGVAPPPAEVSHIIDCFHSRQFAAGAGGSIERDPSANEMHVAKILSSIDPEPVREAKFRVVLDSVNGAGGAAGRMLLESLGCEIIHLNSEPSGYFVHDPEPLEENLRDLAERTSREAAACGFAQDPDADRLAIIDENGRYIGEEYTLVLAAGQVLSMSGPGVIATNLSTSRMIDDLVERHPGSCVVRTAVGEANVVAAMKSARAIVGGEGNGGVIFPPPRGVCWVRDSLSAIALVLGLLASDQRALSNVVDAIPPYRMVKEKIDLASLGGREVIGLAIDRVKRAFADEKINTADGVRVDFGEPEGGWVHVRPSNTEPIIRIIAEAESSTRARELVELARETAGLA